MVFNEAKIGLPSAPSPGLILFNCEDESDIIFIVTLNPNHVQGEGLRKESDKWRFPAHSFIIQESSPFFASLVQQLKGKKSKPIVSIHCQPELFHSLMSYIYKKEIKLNCVTKCLALFEIAIKFGLIDLAVICLTFLQSNLTLTNVIEVLVILDHFQSIKSDYLNSFQSTTNNSRSSNGHQVVNQLSSSLQSNLVNFEVNLTNCIDQCYLIINENGDTILTSESMDSVDEGLLQTILARDSLIVSSELIVFNCLDRWSTIQCVKRQKEVTIGNKIEILGVNIYLVRYLTLSLEIFQRGPYLSDLLSDQDKEAIKSTLTNQSIALPVNLQQYELSKPRTMPSVQLSSTKFMNQLVKKNERNFRLLVNRKSNLSLKKFLTGLGEAIICVIQLLD